MCGCRDMKSETLGKSGKRHSCVYGHTKQLVQCLSAKVKRDDGKSKRFGAEDRATGEDVGNGRKQGVG